MKFRSVIDIMEEIAPQELMMDFDNSGLQCGDVDMEVQGILLALDCTDAVVDEALRLGANVIITHHPLIFHPIKKVDKSNRVGRLLLRLIENRIGLFAAHTNLDIADGGICDELAGMFGMTGVEKVDMTTEQDGYARVGDIVPRTVAELAADAKEKLNAKYVRYTGDSGRVVSRLCVASGSGSSCFGKALEMGAECVISGDIKHDVALDFPAMGLDIIDAGHFATENIILPRLLRHLQSGLDSIKYITVQIAETSVDAFTSV